MFLRSFTEALATLRSYCYSNDHYATLMQSFKLLPHTCGCVHTASGVCSTGCEVKGVKFLRVVVYSMSMSGYAFGSLRLEGLQNVHVWYSDIIFTIAIPPKTRMHTFIAQEGQFATCLPTNVPRLQLL